MSDYLCEELIVEIFTRLSSKSLLRFRSLSKSLRSCIPSPGFIRMHAFRSPKKILFKHCYKSTEGCFYTLHGEDQLPLCTKGGYIGIPTVPSPSSSDFGTVGSCNGIFCLQNSNRLTLWNPSIRRKLSLPELPGRYKPILEGFGFGFDPVSNDYKIIWISYVRDSSFVYGVKTGTWCEIASPKPQCTYVSCEAYLFNGVLHWAIHYPIESQEMYLTASILTFDLSTHVFGMIPLPTPTSHWLMTGLTTIQGSLALISYSMKVDDSWIRVWRDASWSVVFKLNTIQLYIRGALQLQPQPNSHGDLLLGTLEEGIHVYNSKTGVRSKVVEYNAASSLIIFYQCVETLHLLDMGETICETTEL